MNLEPVFVSSSCPLTEFDFKKSIGIGKLREGLNSAVIYDLCDIITTVYPKNKHHDIQNQYDNDHAANNDDDDDDDDKAPSVRMMNQFLKDIGMKFNVQDWCYQDVINTETNLKLKFSIILF